MRKAYAQQSIATLIDRDRIAADISTQNGALYFGGPDKPAYHLRDVLGEWIDAQPKAGAFISLYIIFVTLS